MGLIKLNNEQKLIQNEIRKFAIQEIEPLSQDIEKNGKIPEVVFTKLSDLGLLSPTIPTEYGGAGMDTTSLCIIIEELSKSCASLGLILAANSLIGFVLLKFSSDKFKRYLNRLATGEIGGFSIDNDSKGMDRVQENPLIVKGTKRFVLNGELAKFFLLNLNDDKGRALFLVEKSQIYNTTKPYLLGMSSAGILDLIFDNLQISEDSCIINSASFNSAMEEINCYFYLCLSAIALGISEAGLDASIKYAKERRQFGRAICEFPMVQEMLAEMKIKIESTRDLVYDASSRVDSGEDYNLASEIALATSTETAVYCGIKSVQVFGGYGYTKDYPVERYLRDAKTLQVLAGMPIALREKIARVLLE